MEDPAQRSSGRRLRPILVGLNASVFVFLALYIVVFVVVFALAYRV